jgi:hypothetical protein
VEESKHDESRSSHQNFAKKNRLTVGVLQNSFTIGNKTYNIRLESPRTQ